MQSVIQPKVVQNGSTIDVPIIYANGEKWAQIQSKGFMYDADSKLLAPLISIRRTEVLERDTLKGLAVNRNPVRQNGTYAERNSITLENKYSANNAYDRFSVLRNSRLRRELYVIPVPEFVDITYEMFIWTDYQEQMNSIIESLIPVSGFAWGTTYKFVTMISSMSSGKETPSASAPIGSREVSVIPGRVFISRHQGCPSGSRRKSTLP